MKKCKLSAIIICMPPHLGNGYIKFYPCVAIHMYVCLHVCSSINFCQRFLSLCLLDWFDIWSEALSGWVALCLTFRSIIILLPVCLVRESMSHWHIFSMLTITQNLKLWRAFNSLQEICLVKLVISLLEVPKNY